MVAISTPSGDQVVVYVEAILQDDRFKVGWLDLQLAPSLVFSATDIGRHIFIVQLGFNYIEIKIGSGNLGPVRILFQKLPQRIQFQISPSHGTCIGVKGKVSPTFPL